MLFAFNGFMLRFLLLDLLLSIWIICYLFWCFLLSYLCLEFYLFESLFLDYFFFRFLLALYPLFVYCHLSEVLLRIINVGFWLSLFFVITFKRTKSLCFLRGLMILSFVKLNLFLYPFEQRSFYLVKFSMRAKKLCIF